MRQTMMERIRRDERGVAMITALLVTAVLTALGLTVTQVAVSNLSNAGRDRVSGGAFGAAEAGVTRAIAYINKNNTQALSCWPCTSLTSWGNPDHPQVVSLPDGRTAKVYIHPIQPYAPPLYKVGVYRIRSVGNAGTGPGQRTIEVDVQVRPMAFPLGIFTKNKINNGGTGTVYSESVLSEACIDSRDHLTFVGTDPYYGIPAAAHSAKYITNSNVNGGCDNDLTNVYNRDNKAIHRASVGHCNATYPFDQDNAPLGGTFPSGSACSTGPGGYTSSSSLFTLEMLKADPYNYLPRGLTDAQYALLKARAQALGTYYTTSAPPSWPSALNTTNPVIYFKIPAGQEVSIQTDLNSYAWTADAGCGAVHPAAIIVVEGGDLRLNSNANVSGAIFVPDGSLTYNGGAQLVGTVFTKQLNMSGNSSITLNDCYAKSTPGGILEIKPVRFREVDR
jgi:hypothetical protein